VFEEIWISFFSSLLLRQDEFLRKLSNKNREVKENDPSFAPKLLDIWYEMR